MKKNAVVHLLHYILMPEGEGNERGNLPILYRAKWHAAVKAVFWFAASIIIGILLGSLR